MRLSELSEHDVRRRLRNPGLCIRTGPFVTRIRTTVRQIVEGLITLYADHPVVEPCELADFHTRFALPPTHRRWRRPKLYFYLDRTRPFLPLPINQSLPLFEWALNWCVSSRVQQYLIVHAAVVERGGRAMIMPAPPGSGKSTLCAALVNRGWRLLSDELTLIDPADGSIVPLVRPVSLKNQSIDVIRGFAPRAVLSKPAPGTNKGVVAHMKPPIDSVERMDERATPGWIVFPQYVPGAQTQLVRRDKADTFLSISDNAFNYSVLGRQGFDVMSDLMDACDCYDFEYSSLDEAIGAFDDLAAAPPTANSRVAVPRDTVAEVRATAHASPPAECREAGHDHPLLRALCDPAQMPTLTLRQWDVLIRQARQVGVLGRLAYLAEDHGVTERLPAKVNEHLLSARLAADKHRRSVLWETEQIAEVLRPAGVRFVLLKGAAYIVANLPPGRGRLVSDVDILVAREQLDDAEHALTEHGWATTKLDRYDQRYYRDWMHELPPLQHQRRGSMLDVHHTILPITARLRPDPALLLADAVAAGADGALMLSPADMVLHSATHLFHEGELPMALRDLADLDALMRAFAQRDASFWTTLVERGRRLQLARPLFYALRLTHALFRTPVPDAALAESAADGPGPAIAGVMDRLFTRVALPGDPDRTDPLTALAALLLYVRGHWLRMPPGMLVRHLSHKACLRLTGAADGQNSTDDDQA